MKIENAKNALVRIWGSESHNISLVLATNGRLYAECESTLDRRLLTESNHVEQLNDMFYDFCVENADWMGG